MNLDAGTLPLLMSGEAPWHWALSGAALGAITLLLLWTTNIRLGISTSYESFCSLVSDLPYFRREAMGPKGRWRFAFAGGLVAGGLVSALLAGGLAPAWELGIFDARIGWGPAGKVAWMFAGGLLIGLGTRTAGGCTSGHGLFGLAHLERAAIRSVLAFLATGILTANLVFRVLFPAGG